MARIQEQLKWLNEQLKKKHIKIKSSNVAVEEDLKQCIYCRKVFLNSTYVVKHIFKRHAEQFLCHYKKCIDTTKIEADLDSQPVLMNYLKNEFSNLKTEVEVIKKAVTRPTGFQECKGSSEVSNINTPEDKLIQNNPEVGNPTREDFVKLQEKIEEVSQMYKHIVSSSKGKEDRICKRLKHELLTDFENLLICYQDQNCEWKEHFLQMRNDFQRLEQTVELNTGKIESPEVLQEIENKIEQKIESFYADYGIVGGRGRTSAKTSGKVSKDSSLNVHRSNRRKKSIYTCGSQDLNLSKKQLDSPLKANVSHLQTGLSETRNAHTSSILKGNSENIQELGVKKAKVLFEEKLKNLSISPKVKGMSTDEYETKVHLLRAQKELLSQKSMNFQQYYERVDSHANKLVKSRLERKLRKQLRFSDPIPGNTSEIKDKVISEHISGKSSLPVENIKSGFIQQSEFMHGFDAYGDISDIQNEYYSSEHLGNLGKGDCALSVGNEKKDAFKFQEHFGTSPSNLPPSDAFSELKLINNPHKSLSHNLPNDSLKSLDEFSELSSLESDTNLSQY